jgi:hypothetical protein
MSGKNPKLAGLPGNIGAQKFTQGIADKYPNLDRINENSNDIENSERMSQYSQMSLNRD